MAIENRNVQPGDEFVATYKKVEHRATAFSTAEGIAYTLHTDNSIHRSLSAAGSRMMGGVSCNGWRVWSRVGEIGERPSKDTNETADGSKKSSTPVKPEMRQVKVIKRIPNQRGVDEGSTKWHCSACMESFVAEGTALPAACPRGHAAESADELAGAPKEAEAAE